MITQPYFLLLNTSNILPGPGFSTALLYPYAFVQVREIADRYGITVKTLDISVVEGPEGIWQRLVDNLISEYPPVAVGVTIRQVDSLNVFDSLDGKPRFDPIGLAQRLIRFLRSRTTAPIVLGGFGFTAMAQALFSYLQPDYGVRGGPDGFFAGLSDLIQGRGLAEIPNLVRWSGGDVVFNPRQNFSPAPRPEYTHGVLEDIQRFYGSYRLYSPLQFMGLPVELSRGCPYSCSFCIEPLVKGQEVRFRDLDIVMEDVEFLARKGVSKFWLICSEINFNRKNDIILNVAERMTKLREKYGQHLTWNAYLLPREYSRQEIGEVLASGFLAAGNDLVSLHPAAMKRAQLPYNPRHSKQWLENYKLSGEALAPGRTLDWSIFLGHEGNDPESIRVTLETLEDMELLEYFDEVLTINASRVFDIQQREHQEKYLFRVLPTDKTGIDSGNINAFPTYYYHHALVDILEGIPQVETFFLFLQCSILSNQNKTRFEAGRFLREALGAREFAAAMPAESDGWNTDPNNFYPLFNRRVMDPNTLDAALRLCGEIGRSTFPDKLLSQVWHPPFSAHERSQAEIACAAARILLFQLFTAHQESCGVVLRDLGFEGVTARDIWSTTSFAVHRTLFQKFGTQPILDGFAAKHIEGGTWNLLGAIFYRFVLAFNGVTLKPEYRIFFVNP